MNKRENYKEEMEEIIDLRNQGFKLDEIAEITGIPKGTISCRLSRLKASGAGMEKKEKGESNAAEVKEKTLDDFAPRDIFKHLHKLGYRLEGKVYMMTKQYVNIQSIINE